LRPEVILSGVEWSKSGSDSEDQLNELNLTPDIALCQPSNLSFTDHVHCFISLDRPFCAGERAEAETGIDAPFDCTVILLDDIVEIRNHAAATSLAQCMLPLQLVDHRGTRRIAVDIDNWRTATSWSRKRFPEEHSGGG
jgi:hypothetical protein